MMIHDRHKVGLELRDFLNLGETLHRARFFSSRRPLWVPLTLSLPNGSVPNSTRGSACALQAYMLTQRLINPLRTKHPRLGKDRYHTLRGLPFNIDRQDDRLYRSRPIALHPQALAAAESLDFPLRKSSKFDAQVPSSAPLLTQSRPTDPL